ncbi:MAG TPA: hypothetical protein VJN18_28035 [Polyangiaceae bacterium]|nr:hypothetical protein [Polyangiaceae bacterium]
MSNGPGKRALEAAVFKHIRDNPNVSAGDLTRNFDVLFAPPLKTDIVGAVYMNEVLAKLESAGLVLRQGDGKAATYATANWWPAVQQTLSISLTDLSLRQTGSGLFVEPIFGLPARSRSRQASAFIVIPFSEAMNRVYDAIQSAFLECDLKPVRGDDLYASNAHQTKIIDQVWSAMYTADFVLADCTGRNPNVMYELGMAHTLGKPVLLVAQSQDDIPFDIGHLRFVLYSPDDLERLQLEIVKSVRAAQPLRRHSMGI